MERVRFCRHCGELLDDRWMHCPWCGTDVHRGHEILWETLMDDSMGLTEHEQIRGRIVLLDDISGRLDNLELELDAFLSGKI